MASRDSYALKLRWLDSDARALTEAEGLGAVQVLDNVSLKLRGKAPKRVMG